MVKCNLACNLVVSKKLKKTNLKPNAFCYLLVFALLLSFGKASQDLCNKNSQINCYDSRWKDLCPNGCMLNKERQESVIRLHNKVCDVYNIFGITWKANREKLGYLQFQKLKMKNDIKIVKDVLSNTNRTVESSKTDLNLTRLILDHDQQILDQISEKNKLINTEFQKIFDDIDLSSSQGCSSKDSTLSSCPLPINIGRDCAELYLKGERKNGVYFIKPDLLSAPIRVYCDMEDAGGGWTIIQRRFDGSLNFNRNWNDYRNGFGQWSCNNVGELWLGNQNIYKLTQQNKQQLKIDLSSWKKEERYAWYSYFRIGNETERYRLRFIEGYRRDPNEDIGNAFRGFADRHVEDQKKMEFSIRNYNNRASTSNCASGTGGWWFNKCNLANLNSNWHHYGKSKQAILRRYNNYQLMWKTWNNKYLKKTTMKIRPLGFNSNSDHGLRRHGIIKG